MRGNTFSAAAYDCPNLVKGANLLASRPWHCNTLSRLRIPVSLILSTPCVNVLTKPTLAVDVLYLSPNDRRRMLRLTILESPAEQRFVVEGKLMQPWVSELESAWESARDARRGRRCVVDLSDTTGIDRSGRRLLMAMCGEGVRFIAKGST